MKNAHKEVGFDQGILKRIETFNRERNWDQFHNPKDLAISLSLEAAELLECFQWSGKDLHVHSQREAILEEVADVLIYALQLCLKLEVDPSHIIRKKLDQNERKYPVEQAFGSAQKYTDLGRKPITDEDVP